MNRIFYRMGRITVFLLFILIFLLGLFLAVRHVIKADTLKKHRITSSSGIDEEVVVEAGGILQYLNIRGQDTSNPVILFLHGGPGGTMTSVIHSYQYLWENDYTVVNWDQRNAGKTYFLNDEKDLQGSLSADILVEDMKDIVIYLTERFHTDSVIIMGHSWGTVIGSRFALKYPQLTTTYIGVGQTINIHEGILKMAEYVFDLAKDKGQEKDISAVSLILKELNDGVGDYNIQAVQIYKIAEKYVSVDLDGMVFLRHIFFSPYYSLKDLTYYMKQEALSKPLIDYLDEYDLRTFGYEYKVPVIYILGEKDWHTKLLAEEYFKGIEAPYKVYIEIPEAGHVAMVNKPKEFFRAFDDAIKQNYRYIEE